MKEKKVFCEECRKDVNFAVEDKQMEGTIKGISYKYMGKIARCTDCQSEIYVAEVNDYNLKALYDEYRKKNNIISLEEILEISQKYGIGKRPLSLLLGWGEHTFSRYCDGDIPTKQYSEELKKINEDPHYYNEILEKNKANLNSEITYTKSKKAVEKLIGKDSNQKSKINIAIEYLLNKCEDITPLALQKLLYYVQGFYYAINEEFLFEEDCQAWVHGPVYPEVYQKYKDYRFDPIKQSSEPEDLGLTSSETAILDSVSKNLSCYSGKVLEEFTHSETPWLKAREHLSKFEPTTRIIQKEDIGNYFNEVKEKYKMTNPDDIKLYAQNKFERLYRR